MNRFKHFAGKKSLAWSWKTILVKLKMKNMKKNQYEKNVLKTCAACDINVMLD